MSPSANGFVIEHEQFVLGTLLLGGGLKRVRGFLEEHHFEEPMHAEIYRAMGEAFEQSGTTAAPIVLKLLPSNVVRAFEERTEITLATYLARLTATSVHTVEGIEKAAKAVVEQWARLRLVEAADRLSASARAPSSSVQSLLQSAGSALEEIATSIRKSRTRSVRLTAGQAGSEAIRAAREAVANGGALTGITWGYADVDRLTGGMQRRDLILCGARPSMGKTSLMMSTALAAGRKGEGVGILSLEMDAPKLTARALSDLSFSTHQPVEYTDILRGRLDENALQHLEQMNARLDSYPIEIDESPVNTFDIRMKIETMLERFERAGWPRLSCLMLDHLGFVQPGAHYRGNRNNEVGEITRALKDFAKEYDIAILLLSQLSRQLTQRESKRPVLSDLRDSGNIEQDADVVVLLHREAYYLERAEEGEPEKQLESEDRLARCRHQLEFIIAKQRNGPVQSVNLWCDMAFSAVRNGDRYR